MGGLRSLDYRMRLCVQEAEFPIVREELVDRRLASAIVVIVVHHDEAAIGDPLACLVEAVPNRLVPVAIDMSEGYCPIRIPGKRFFETSLSQHDSAPVDQHAKFSKILTNNPMEILHISIVLVSVHTD